MRPKLRRSQLVGIWGPGALVDLPDDAVIIAGLDEWPRPDQLEKIEEPRLSRLVGTMTGVPDPPLYAPPIPERLPGREGPGITAFRFPEWYLVQEGSGPRSAKPVPESRPTPTARRLVKSTGLDKGRFEGHDVVPTRFVRACPRGHIEDFPWYAFVHREAVDAPAARDSETAVTESAPSAPEDEATASTEPTQTPEVGSSGRCRRQLWLVETGTGGDLADLSVRCECGASRSLLEAVDVGNLGQCGGSRPWLGKHTAEGCGMPSRLLIRTATNAYFPKVLSALSLPNQGTAVERVVRDLWTQLQIVEDALSLGIVKRFPGVNERLAPFTDEEVLTAIDAVRHGGGSEERPVKLVEIDAILAAPEGYEEEVPIDPAFHARALPRTVWHKSTLGDRLDRIVQLHRLREVRALVGFTRFEAEMPDIFGEYGGDVEAAALAREPAWYPAVENRGEGLFVALDPTAVAAWKARPAVIKRAEQLEIGHLLWREKRSGKGPMFPGVTYVMLHTLSHLLLQSVALRAGYGASSIRERVYVDEERHHYGVLLYTGTSDAEGTLGGLVQQARHVEMHLRAALRAAALCSNDPICAQHAPNDPNEDRWLHGAACHGCALIAETSCEMRNDHLDRALVVPALGHDPATAFFDPVP
jgi:hypothetical protein